jgi:hypothetical protein
VVNVLESSLGFHLRHGFHHRRSLDAERTGDVLRSRRDALENTPRPVAGITPSPNARWMKQVCRDLTDCEDGFLKDASHLIVDRDTSFIAMRKFLEQHTETKVVLLPPNSPNLNAYMERWFRSLKSECLERMIFFGRKSLENAVREYVEQYHAERNHQGLANELIELIRMMILLWSNTELPSDGQLLVGPAGSGKRTLARRSRVGSCLKSEYKGNWLQRKSIITLATPHFSHRKFVANAQD